MEVEHPNELPLTEEEAKELETLKEMIEKAIEDGVITRTEFEALKTTVFTRGITTAAQINRQLLLYRQLVTEKVKQGEILIEPPQ